MVQLTATRDKPQWSGLTLVPVAVAVALKTVPVSTAVVVAVAVIAGRVLAQVALGYLVSGLPVAAGQLCRQLHAVAVVGQAL